MSCSKCLVICSKNSQLLSHIHICPKPKVKLDPTETFYPAPPSLDDIATAKNLVFLVSPIGISVSLRWDCNLSVYVHYQKLVSPSLSNRYYRDYNANPLVSLLPKSVPQSLCNRSHRVCLTNSLVSLLPKSVLPSMCNRSHQDYVMP